MEQKWLNEDQTMEVQFPGGEACSVSLFHFKIICDGLAVESRLDDAIFLSKPSEITCDNDVSYVSKISMNSSI